MKSDGERNIVALRDALSKYHGGQMTPEQFPRGESQANGKTEEAGKTVRGMAKVLKDQMEEKAKIQIGGDAVVMQWAIRWTAMLLFRFKLGEDGKTVHDRQKGKKCKQEVVPFGEQVWYTKLRERNMASRLWRLNGKMESGSDNPESAARC